MCLECIDGVYQVKRSSFSFLCVQYNGFKCYCGAFSAPVAEILLYQEADSSVIQPLVVE